MLLGEQSDADIESGLPHCRIAEKARESQYIARKERKRENVSGNKENTVN